MSCGNMSIYSPGINEPVHVFHQMEPIRLGKLSIFYLVGEPAVT
jgi:hypothetical protein